jgi:peptidoglycan/xylan/chitin deacetylase (PgdA/CDA1 family)
MPSPRHLYQGASGRNAVTRLRAARGGGVVAAMTVALLALGACSGGGHPRAVGSPSASARPSASVSARPTPKPSPSHTTRVDPIDAIIARLPKFGEAPDAVPVTLPTGPNAKIFYRVPTTQKVAFLTMDDGLWQLSSDLKVMKAAHIPFTMFLIAPVAAKNPTFFKALRGYGGVIEDHTLTHTELDKKPYDFQKHEICGARDKLRQTFGPTPTLFRPPYGDYDTTTLKATHDCGMKAAFYWSETVNNGKVYYQTANHVIKPGDIILMHFRPAFAKDVLAALLAIKKAGLTPALLEDYITPRA